jgi:hypothetical protein
VARRPPHSGRHLPPRLQVVGERRDDGGHRRRLPRAGADVGRGHRGQDLPDPARRVPSQAGGGGRAARHQADRPRDPRQWAPPHLSPAGLRSRLPRVRVRGHHRVHALGAGAGSAHAPGHGAPQPVPLGPREDASHRGGQAPRRRLRGGVSPAQPGRGRVHPAREGRPPPALAPAGARRVAQAGGALPAGGGEPALLGDAADRGAGRLQGRARLHQRRHHPERRLLLVADDRRGDRAQDGHPRAPLHGAGPRPHGAPRRPRRPRQGGAGTGRDRRRPLLLVHEREDDALSRHLALGPPRHVPDPRLLRHRGRLRGSPLRARGGGAAAPGGRAPGARRLRREVLGQDRHRAHLAHDLRRRRPTSRCSRPTRADR